jgi:hypothetical protein
MTITRMTARFPVVPIGSMEEGSHRTGAQTGGAPKCRSVRSQGRSIRHSMTILVGHDGLMSDGQADETADATGSGLGRRVVWMALLASTLVVMQWARSTDYAAFRGWPGFLSWLVIPYLLFISIGGPVWVFLTVLALGIEGQFRPWGPWSRFLLLTIICATGAALVLLYQS